MTHTLETTCATAGFVNAGVFAVADLLGGPVLAYTPPAGFVGVAGMAGPGCVPVDSAMLVAGVKPGPKSSAVMLTVSQHGIVGGDSFIGGAPPITLTSPLYVGIAAEGEDMGGPWQANTNYDSGLTGIAGVAIEAGHVWENDGAAGTSGSSKPDFAGNIGGTVSDGGGISWLDAGPVPSVGAIEVWLLVAPLVVS